MSDTSSLLRYRPAVVSPPGETIGDLLEERELRQAELAVRMGVSPKFVNELIAGKAAITPTTALALEKALDVPADFWLVREARYQEARARAVAIEDLNANVPWLDELPIIDMLKFKLLKPTQNKASMVENCLRFFAVASVPAWRKQYVEQANASAAYRASDRYRKHPGAVATWLRVGEIEASQITCAPFDRDQFLAALTQARKMTLDTDPASFMPRLKAVLADCGIALVIARAPTGCPLYGAVRWLSPQKALIQLSVRGLRSDSFWFTFFHECGHIALHGKKILFLEGEGMSGTEEQEANQFAADRLIPPTSWASFAPFSVSEQAICDFARSIGIAPGIVLGRLQNDKRLPWNRFPHLRSRYKWTDD